MSFAIVVFVLASVLACSAIAAFPWSNVLAKLLVTASALTSAIAAATADGRVDSGTWAFLFASISCVSCLVAAAMIFGRLTRWIHRFAIYTGYGATFSAMGAMALLPGLREAGAMSFTAALITTWIIGSAGIFAAKTLLIRYAAKNITDYKS